MYTCQLCGKEFQSQAEGAIVHFVTPHGDVKNNIVCISCWNAQWTKAFSEAPSRKTDLPSLLFAAGYKRWFIAMRCFAGNPQLASDVERAVLPDMEIEQFSPRDVITLYSYLKMWAYGITPSGDNPLWAKVQACPLHIMHSIGISDMNVYLDHALDCHLENISGVPDDIQNKFLYLYNALRYTYLDAHVTGDFDYLNRIVNERILQYQEVDIYILPSAVEYIRYICNSHREAVTELVQWWKNSKSVNWSFLRGCPISEVTQFLLWDHIRLVSTVLKEG